MNSSQPWNPQSVSLGETSAEKIIPFGIYIGQTQRYLYHDPTEDDASTPGAMQEGVDFEGALNGSQAEEGCADAHKVATAEIGAAPSETAAESDLQDLL